MGAFFLPAIVSAEWKQYGQLNCFEGGHGAQYDVADKPDKTGYHVASSADCRQMCTNYESQGCDTSVYSFTMGTCFLRHGIIPSQCDNAYNHPGYDWKDGWDTWSMSYSNSLDVAWSQRDFFSATDCGSKPGELDIVRAIELLRGRPWCAIRRSRQAR